jgi:exopolysaccharide production protein ExoQ
VALATNAYPIATSAPVSLRLPIADLVVVFGIVIFGTNILEVTLRGGSLERFIGIVYMGCYVAGLVLAVLSRAVPQALVRQPLLAFLLLLPVASALWSVDRDMTLFRTMMLLGTSIFGLFIGWHYERAHIIRLLAIGVSLNLCISAALIVAVPSIGIDSTAAWAGTWVGAYMHKNGLGAAVGIAMLVLFYAIATSRGVVRLGFLAMLALAAVLLVGSRSATALVVAILALLLALGFSLWRRAPGLVLASLVAAALFLPLLSFLAIGQSDLVLRMLLDGLEKDVTVHGRTDIWHLVWPYIVDRFWLGYGYGSFWQPGFPWFNLIQARLHYAPHYSHNGVIETWIAGGAVMVLAALLVYMGALARALILAVRERSAPDAAFAFVFLVSFALRNVTEASLLQGNDFLWLLFVALVVSTAKSVAFSLRSPAAGPASHA